MEENLKEYIYVYIYMNKSLCCVLEINTTLCINYTSMKRKLLESCFRNWRYREEEAIGSQGLKVKKMMTVERDTLEQQH